MINTRVGNNLGSSNTSFIDKINQIVNIERSSCGSNSFSMSKNSSGSDENTSSASSSLNDLTELDNLLDELYTAKVILTNKDTVQTSHNHKQQQQQQQQLTANVSYDSATSPSSSSPLSTSSSFSVNSASQNNNNCTMRCPNVDSFAQRVSNSRSSVEKMLQLVAEKSSSSSEKY
jgi:hypothetical protein